MRLFYIGLIYAVCRLPCVFGFLGEFIYIPEVVILHDFTEYFASKDTDYPNTIPHDGTASVHHAALNGTVLEGLDNLGQTACFGIL